MRFGEDEFQNLLLGGSHFFGFGWSDVIKAGEMKEAMDDVEGEFLSCAMAELGSACSGNVRTDKNLAIRKGDDIRRARYVEKIAVHFCHGAGAEDSDLDARQRDQFGVVFFGKSEAVGNGCCCEALQKLAVVGDGASIVGSGCFQQR